MEVNSAMVLLQAAPIGASTLGLKLGALLSTIIYSAIGMAVFAVAFLLINKLVPFSLRKEIEEDQNIALGVIIGSVMLALGIIIAAAIV